MLIMDKPAFLDLPPGVSVDQLDLAGGFAALFRSWEARVAQGGMAFLRSDVERLLIEEHPLDLLDALSDLTGKAEGFSVGVDPHTAWKWREELQPIPADVLPRMADAFRTGKWLRWARTALARDLAESEGASPTRYLGLRDVSARAHLVQLDLYAASASSYPWPAGLRGACEVAVERYLAAGGLLRMPGSALDRMEAELARLAVDDPEEPPPPPPDDD
jgi:hypothetical protein